MISLTPWRDRSASARPSRIHIRFCNTRGASRHQNRKADMRVMVSRRSVAGNTSIRAFHISRRGVSGSRQNALSVNPCHRQKLEFTFWLQPGHAPSCISFPVLAPIRLAGNELGWPNFFIRTGSPPSTSAARSIPSSWSTLRRATFPPIHPLTFAIYMSLSPRSTAVGSKVSRSLGLTGNYGLLHGRVPIVIPCGASGDQ